jgi:hypothetical protein
MGFTIFCTFRREEQTEIDRSIDRGGEVFKARLEGSEAASNG